MPSKKEQRHAGQKPLINQFDEPAQDEQRPKGMPSLQEIQTEVARRGLLASDAEYLYNSWLVNGFKTARGLKILNWRAAVRNWQILNYFPSQRKSGFKLHDAAKERDEKTFERMKREARNGDR